MTIQRAAFAAVAFFCVAQHPQDVFGFTTNTNPIAAKPAFPSATTTTAIRSEPPTSASEKAQELRKRAEEAKRKAEELKKVAEQKAEAVMVAVKKANDLNDDTSVTTTVSAVKAPPTPPVASSTEKASARTTNTDPGSAIIPINSENVEFTSGILGGAVALALGASPVFAVVAAAAANYISKKEDLGELNEFVQAISKASLNSINFLARLDSKYTILGRISASLDKAINDLKSDEGNAETFKKIEDSVKQIQTLADEIDLLEGGKQALGAVGDVLETSIDKAVDANEEYKLTERAAEAAKKAIEKAKSASL
ncbi:hypothetical protein ACHAWU_004019 [Discostella pseudostelligera]|uniref:Uncharacterized protein n=1 Tax=Discostella pseudostelligera TaxID=259834 RepID=A0ABD3ML33_9STRA